MNDSEINAKLRELLYWLIDQITDGSDIDSLRFEEFCDQLGLIKKVDAPEDDEFDYYLFPIWASEQEVKNGMGGER